MFLGKPKTSGLQSILWHTTIFLHLLNESLQNPNTKKSLFLYLEVRSSKRYLLGITIGSYICGKYNNFFLNLMYLFLEINDADILSIRRSLKSKGLFMIDIISCTTGNCLLMIWTGDKLLTW